MIEIEVDNYDSFSQAWKRFKGLCQQTGLNSEIKRHKAREKPCEMKRKKKLKATRRAIRRQTGMERSKKLLF